jgi:hypothetical protein
VIRSFLLLAFGALALLASPAGAQGTTSQRATASVNVMKPLQLTTVRNLQFGTILVGSFTGDQNVSVTPSGRTCGSGTGLTCSGVFNTAQFRVTGTNNQIALISSATSTVSLTNATGATLVMTPTFPGSVSFNNSGNQGVLFEVGGTMAFTSSMADGVYSGTLEIQVAYQ